MNERTRYILGKASFDDVEKFNTRVKEYCTDHMLTILEDIVVEGNETQNRQLLNIGLNHLRESPGRLNLLGTSKVTVYEAVDGKIFDSRAECQTHEDFLVHTVFESGTALEEVLDTAIESGDIPFYETLIRCVKNYIASTSEKE